MRKFIISFCCYVFFIFTLAAQDKAPHYTVIVSLDAFRWDYPAMYDTPNLNQMAREGVKATMLPSYPASTFPNHYTLATGLVPDHNGIINNTFWDVVANTLWEIPPRGTIPTTIWVNRSGLRHKSRE